MCLLRGKLCLFSPSRYTPGYSYNCSVLNFVIVWTEVCNVTPCRFAPGRNPRTRVLGPTLSLNPRTRVLGPTLSQNDLEKRKIVSSPEIPNPDRLPLFTNITLKLIQVQF